MHIYRLIMVTIGLFFLASTVMAAVLTPSTISSSNTGWLVANGKDVSTITVNVHDGTEATNVAGATVTFSMVDSSLGTIPSGPVTTDINGIATAVFTTSTKSGNATINAHILYNDGIDNILDISTFQRIDHDTIQTPYYDYKTVVPVGSITPLIITLKDRSGNRIDNKNDGEEHTVHLTTMSGTGGSGFFNGSGYYPEIYKPTDIYGNVSVDFRVSTVAGNNIIQMEPIGNIAIPPPIYIEGVANSSDPITLTQILPTPSSWPADGLKEHEFNLLYFVKDQYDNPVSGTTVLLTTSAGESKVLTTNTYGIASTTYIKDVSGFYTLQASTPSNASIYCKDTATVGYCSQVVEFYSTEPVQMILSANPQTLVSTDVDATSTAIVRARVMDIRGNPVNEYPEGTPVTVTFTQGPVTYPGAPGGTFTETVGPALSSTTAPMGTDGFATIEFTPGKFAKVGETGYNATATATCTVTATWIDPSGVDINRDVTFVWKNYPFLTINSEFSRSFGNVGDFLDVTIKIKGDGAALQPKPIDVVLVMDRSGSMYGSRMTSAKTAANTFVDKMKTGNNQVGLVSFASDTEKDQTLTNDFDGVKNKINDLDANGATQMRRALYEAITEVDTNGRPEAVKAVILLTDGDWNYDGSLLGHGTGWPEKNYNYEFSGYSNEPDNYRYYDGLGGTVMEQPVIIYYDWRGRPFYQSYSVCTDGEFTQQNMSIYANQSEVRVYALSFVAQPGSYVRGALHTMTNSTLGFYRHAPTEAELNTLYTKIAGDLNEEASGVTSAEVNFGDNALLVDETLVSSSEADKYINYTADPVGGLPLGEGSEANSTFIYKYHTNSDGTKFDYYKQVRDDTQNWTPAKKLLQFDVGKMVLHDTWQTTFRLNLTKAGQLVLFPDCGSTVTFVDSSTGKTQSGCIPSGPVSVYESKIDQEFGGDVLKVENLGFIEGATADPGIWKISWDTTYTGTTVAEEKVEYWSSESGSIAKTYAKISPIFPDPATVTRTQEIDTRSWKSGLTYTIRVSAESFDGGSSYATISKPKTADSGTIFIKLE